MRVYKRLYYNPKLSQVSDSIENKLFTCQIFLICFYTYHVIYERFFIRHSDVFGGTCIEYPRTVLCHLPNIFFSCNSFVIFLRVMNLQTDLTSFVLYYLLTLNRLDVNNRRLDFDFQLSGLKFLSSSKITQSRCALYRLINVTSANNNGQGTRQEIQTYLMI